MAKVAEALRSRTAATVYRIILAGSAAVCLLLSFNPRQELGLASMLYVFFWPLAITQLVAGLLPWAAYFQKHGTNAVVIAYTVAVFAFFIDLFFLQLIGYVGLRQ